MKLPKIFLRKFILGALLLLVCAGITLYIKDSLDTETPSTAVPILTVQCNGSPLAQGAVYVAGYKWNFFWNSTEKLVTAGETPDDIREQIVPANVLPRTPLQLEFTTKPLSVTVSRASDPNSENFILLELDDEGVFYVPGDTLTYPYIYKVEANFSRGSVIYYFGLTVTEMY